MHAWKTPSNDSRISWCCVCGTLRFKMTRRFSFWKSTKRYEYVTTVNHPNGNFNKDVLLEEPDCT